MKRWILFAVPALLLVSCSYTTGNASLYSYGMNEQVSDFSMEETVAFFKKPVRKIFAETARESRVFCKTSLPPMCIESSGRGRILYE